MCAPSQSNFFHFHAGFGENLLNNKGKGTKALKSIFIALVVQTYDVINNKRFTVSFASRGMKHIKTRKYSNTKCNWPSSANKLGIQKC